MHRSNMRKRFLPFLVVLVALTAIMMTAAFAEGEAEYVSNFYASPLSLLPPVIAIILALITKEVYSSLFVGILVGGLLYANFDPELTIMTMFFNEDGGMIYKISDSWNAGILVFLVILGIMVALMNKAGRLHGVRQLANGPHPRPGWAGQALHHAAGRASSSWTDYFKLPGPWAP